ncbi:MAG: diacylglycerol/lipid kinase family protein [Eubacterium sp.]
MEHLVLVNPAAGRGSQKGKSRARKHEAGVERFMQNIRDAAEKNGLDVRIEKTEGPGDAEKKAAAFAEAAKGSPARIYACGGDGTLNEVINGISGHPEVEAGVFPIGTGNDTIRNFTDSQGRPLRREVFLDPERQFRGKAAAVDLLRYEGVLDGRFQSRLCVNMLNNGFDCNVVARAGELKQKRFISGSAAYLLAVFSVFIKKQGISLRVTADGKEISRGNILLCAVANGCYCGGGIKGLPMARMNDGRIELSILKDMKRRTFLHLLPKYADGTYLKTSQAESIVIRGKYHQVRLEPEMGKTFLTCADGEISETRGITVTALPGELRFIVPA